MIDDPNPSPDPPNDPPKPSTGFKGKPPKRRLSRKKGARCKQHDLPQEDDASSPSSPSAPELHTDVDGDSPPPAAASSLRPKIEARGAKRKISNAEYKFELKRVYAELDASKASLELKESENSALKKRNKTLASQLTTASDAVRASRSAAREAGSTARATTKEAGSEADKLSRLLERAEADLADARQQLETKEMEMKQQSSQHKTKLDEAIMKSVDEAKEKAEVCIILLFISLTNISFIAITPFTLLYFLQKDVRRRHVDQLNKQHESKMFQSVYQRVGLLVRVMS
jgi:hypothetical protein